MRWILGGCVLWALPAAPAPRPAVLLDKKTSDAHDHPTLALDASGHLWVFSNAHGTSRPS
jgi:hypothetical protein